LEKSKKLSFFGKKRAFLAQNGPIMQNIEKTKNG